jgi:cytoskeletal protein CcmA (bactofilin family)
MFSRAKPAQTAGTALVPAPAPARARGAQRNRGPSIIAADLHIVGNVSTEGELHVDGRIDGDVEGRSVTIGPSGYVDGHVETTEITVHGIVRGSIRARKVRLADGCRVVADIVHDVIGIDSGASFEGHCRRVAGGHEGGAAAGAGDDLTLADRVA